MAIHVRVKIDCSGDMYRVRISNPVTSSQNWIKFYPSRVLCVTELRYLGMLTHLEASGVLQDDFCGDGVRVLRHIPVDVDVLKMAGFIERKSRCSPTWKSGTSQFTKMG
jgi:hypothetical protein